MSEAGYLDYDMLCVVLKQICARVYLATAPDGAEWVAVASQDFGQLYYHREKGTSQREPPPTFVTLPE